MNREITVHLIASTVGDEFAIIEWLRTIGAENFVNSPQFGGVCDEREGDVKLEGVIGLAAKRCYMSFEPGLNPNVTKIREDWAEYLENILRVGHGSVLEHATFTFAIENVTRVFTAEMNRHRAGCAISEGSMRFIRFDEDIPWWLPDSIRGEDVLGQDEVESNLADGYGPEFRSDGLRGLIGQAEVALDAGLDARKQITRAIFTDVFDYVRKRYAQLVAVWDMDESDKDFAYKKAVTSCLRRIVPMGVCTGGVWTLNVRALRHVLTMRCAPEAEEEIRRVALTMLSLVRDQHPWLFGDFDESGKPKHRKV